MAQTRKIGGASTFKLWTPFGAEASILIAICVSGTLVCVMAMLSLALLPIHMDGPWGPVLGAAILTAISVCGLLISIFDRKRGLLDLLFWFFFAFASSWPGLIQSLNVSYPWGRLSYSRHALPAALATALFLLSYLVGSRMKAERNIQLQTSVVPAKIEISFAIGMFMALMIFISVGCAIAVGPANLISLRSDIASGLDNKAFAYPYFIGKGVALSGLIVSLSATLSHGARYRTRQYVFLAVFAALSVAWFYPPANPRFQMLAFILTFIAFPSRRFGPDIKAIFVASLEFATIFILGPIKDVGRGQLNGLLNSSMLKSYITSADFDTYQLMSESYSYVTQTGFSKGTNLLGAVLFWVPRPLWPSKPLPSGQLVTYQLGYLYQNISCSFPSELYIAFGFPACVLGGLLTGLLLTKLDYKSRLEGSFGVASFSSAWMVLISAYLTIMLRGSIGAVSPFFGEAFIGLGAVQLVAMLSRRKVRGPRSLATGLNRSRSRFSSH